MKNIIFILIGIGFILTGIAIIVLDQRPTHAEVQSMIEGNTTSIFHINNAGKLQSCLYTLILIELNEIEGLELRQELENHVKWMAMWEDMREKRAREEFEGK